MDHFVLPYGRSAVLSDTASDVPVTQESPMEVPRRERRFKAVWLPKEALVDVLDGRAGISVIPTGAAIDGIAYDFASDSIHLRLVHPSFEPVALGVMIPTVDVIAEVRRPEPCSEFLEIVACEIETGMFQKSDRETRKRVLAGYLSQWCGVTFHERSRLSDYCLTGGK